MKPLEGLIAAAFTPMNEDGTVNLGVIPQYAQRLVQDGVRGVLICGTTGEGFSLTLEERMALAQAWKAAIPADFTLMVHVGHTSLEAACRLVRHAATLGADAVAATGPLYYKVDSAEYLAAYCEALAAAEPSMPFFYYHAPARSGVHVSMVELLERVQDRIPNFAGIKFTDGDLMELNRCVRFAGGRFDILFGKDEILLAGLAMGARAAVGSTYNFGAPLYLKIIDALERGDVGAAYVHQSAVVDFMAILQRYGGLGAAKAVMRMRGIDCGPVRRPLQPLTPQAYQSLQNDLEGWARKASRERR